MEKAIKLLVWGLLFLLIDIRIITFDLIHDAIGYILLYRGLKQLPQSKWLAYAKASAVILGVLSLTEIFGFSNINLDGLNQDFTWKVPAIGLLSILSLFFHMNVLSSVMTLTESEEILSSTKKFQQFYLIVNLITILSLPAILVFREMAVLYLIILILTGLIVEIIYIVKINSFKRVPTTEDLAS
ncbi:hypothetical protein ACOJQI_05395 [Bacillus salacetis]|uniref:hypothetical protein n=1 Tax=Bacillus salacetis TaxID=2315464 RepID=UPI003BA2D7B4